MSKLSTPTNAVTLPPLLIDARELARLLSVSRASIFAMNSRGQVPVPVRPTGTDPRWNVQELRDWCAAGCPERSQWEAIKSGQPKPNRTGGK